MLSRKSRLLQKVAPVTRRIQAIANPYRMGILYALAKEEEMEVWQIAELLGISPPLVSHHLNLLREALWVKKQRMGKRVFYRFDEKAKELWSRLSGLN